MRRDPALEVADLIHRFWFALDRRDYDGLLDLLTEDCHWLRGAWLVGRAEIAAALAARPAMRIRHLVSNIIVTSREGGLRADFIVTAFAADADHGEKAARSGPPALLADVTMDLSGDSGAFLVSRIEPAIQFRTDH